MNQKFKCPMMCGMQAMHQPDNMFMQPEMPMAENMEMDCYYEDEDDDRQFMKMYPESCRRIMVFVKLEIDIMEENDEMMHDVPPDREQVDRMTDNAYKKMIREIPEMAEAEEKRQYPAGRFSRDLLRVLLLNELLRRRRRRRRMNYFGYPSYGYDFDYDYYDYD